MHKIVEECLNLRSSHTGGTMAFGSQHLFLAYLGGKLYPFDSSGLNTTTDEELDDERDSSR